MLEDCQVDLNLLLLVFPIPILPLLFLLEQSREG
jgi:hypothetical protein